MRDFVEARFDVTFHDPLVGAAREEVNLCDGVLGPASGAEPVAAWVKIRLENGLEHRLEGSLDHPVPHGGDAKAAALATGLGNHHLSHGDRLEPPSLEIISQLGEEGLLAPDDGHVEDRFAIYARRTSTSIAPHPVPGISQDIGVINQIPQVVEPTIRIVGSTTCGIWFMPPMSWLMPGTGCG